MKTKLLHIFLLLGSVSALAQSPEIEVKQSAKIFSSWAPEATYPYEQAEGNIFYTVLKTVQRKRLPIRKCVLFHGYGVNQNLIHLLYRSNKAAGSGLRILINLADLRTPTQGMSNMYFGGPFLADWMSESLCEEIYALFTESTQSTLAEMVPRAEKFLKERVCTEDPDLVADQKSCALIGHSKGGALVTAIARRCMQMTSLMGREACLRIAEIYSQSGAIQGTGIAALMLGLKEDIHGEEFKEMLKKDLAATAPPFDAMRRPDVDVNLDSLIDLFSDHVQGRTNPAWWDLSPLAPIEKGVPIFEANDVTLVKGGWWKGEYAASGGGFVFWPDGYKVPGCGTTWKKDEDERRNIEAKLAKNGLEATASRVNYLRNKRSFRTFTGEIIVEGMCNRFDHLGLRAHEKELQQYFERGKESFAELFKEKYPGKKPTFLDEMTWESFRFTDGFVEARTALNFCVRGSKVKQNRSVTSCRLFDGKTGMTPAVNHYGLAGASLEAVDDLMTELAN